MALIVQKFGGSSVANADRVRNVARIITETYRKGHSVVVVLSAQGDTTDDLIAKAAEINPHASKREMDMLLATGEQISISLCAMAIEAMGYQVVSLTGWQGCSQIRLTVTPESSECAPSASRKNWIRERLCWSPVSRALTSMAT